MFRYATIILAAGALLAESPGRAAEPAGHRPPNIVFIMADDLGYGHLGCYGQQKIRTPNIDRLATEGMRFTQFYSGSTVCAPSRSVLMTGLHTGHTPVRSNSGSSSLLEGEITAAGVLQKAGYATGGFGKWGLGVEGSPGVAYKKGFDRFCGFYHQVHAHFYYPYWIRRNGEKWILSGNDDNQRGQYVADVLHQEVLAFIRRHAQDNRPFFCYVPSIIPHVELTVPEDSAAPYRGKFPKVTIDDPRKGYIGSDDAYVTYAGMISRLDRQVGEIMAILKELDLDRETIVFFTSDNGPQSGPWQPLNEFFNGAGPLSGAKGSLYEGGIRVPLIARWPGKIKPGTTSDHIGGFQDVMPTLAELAAVEPPKSDGVSIVPALLGEPARQKQHEAMYWEFGSWQAVRMGQWKAIRSGRKPWLLYDLNKDVGEKNDVAAANPQVVAKIETIASESHTPPRPQIGGRRVGIRDYVRGERIDVQNPKNEQRGQNSFPDNK